MTKQYKTSENFNREMKREKKEERKVKKVRQAILELSSLFSFFICYRRLYEKKQIVGCMPYRNTLGGGIGIGKLRRQVSWQW
jgi:hypothetical protein